MICRIFKKIKWFIQRGKRGWADCDVWWFQDYLTDIIVAGLKRLKKIGHGCPSEFWDEKAVNDECHKWDGKDGVLESMIQGFEALKELDEGINWKIGQVKKEIDWKKIKLLQEKYKRGMKLFIKYFPNLWD